MKSLPIPDCFNHVMFSYTCLCLIVILVCIVCDALDYGGLNYHSHIVNADDKGNYYCGVCPSSYKYCCPAQLVGCNRSITFCDRQNSITECGDTRICEKALTFDSIASLMLLQVILLHCSVFTYLVIRRGGFFKNDDDDISDNKYIGLGVPIQSENTV